MSQALYDKTAGSYSIHRKSDRRIEDRINSALGKYQNLLNVGSGTGSYEPRDRNVVAIDLSMEMLKRRRLPQSQAIQGSADRLPFRDDSFDAAIAILTIHHWPNPEAGLAEMKRVARDIVVVLTWDPGHSGFWLVRDYFPEVLEIDRPIFPTLSKIKQVLGPSEVQSIEVPRDCTDGFLGAYWQRPEAYLDPSVRAAISTFSKFESAAGLDRLRQDLADGTWHDRNQDLQTLNELDIGYRLVIARYA